MDECGCQHLCEEGLCEESLWPQKTMEIKIVFNGGSIKNLYKISHIKPMDGLIYFSREEAIAGNEFPILHIVPANNIEEIIVKYEEVKS